MLPHAGRFHEHKIKTMDKSLARSCRLGRGSNVRSPRFASLSYVDEESSQRSILDRSGSLRVLLEEVGLLEACFLRRLRHQN